MDRSIGIIVRLFANGSRNRGSIPGRVIPKTQKMVLDASLLNTQKNKVRIKGKWSNTVTGIVPSLQLGVVAIEKGSLRVSLDYCRPTYLIMSGAPRVV